MCTVTYLPLSKDDFILTSSRDVPFSRAKALHPQKYIEDQTVLWYPKDGKAGGSWIGLSDKKRLICLLNGGFEYHTSKSYYRKSRGHIVKQLLKAEDIRQELDRIDLTEIEQFTLVIVDWNSTLELIEFVWDGTAKYIDKKPQKPRIWSSATLYDQSVQQMRKDWFTNWQKENDDTQEGILDFHHTAGIDDPFLDVLMNRIMGGTVSISSLHKHKNKITFIYEDVQSNKLTKLII